MCKRGGGKLTSRCLAWVEAGLQSLHCVGNTGRDELFWKNAKGSRKFKFGYSECEMLLGHLREAQESGRKMEQTLKRILELCGSQLWPVQLWRGSLPRETGSTVERENSNACRFVSCREGPFQNADAAEKSRI